MPAATKRRSLGRSRPVSAVHSSSNGEGSQAVQDEFIMTLESDDEDALVSTTVLAESSGTSNGQIPSILPEVPEQASFPAVVPSKPKAQLGKREKIIDGKGKGKAPSSFDPSAAGDELALDKNFNFDVGEDQAGHTGWNYSNVAAAASDDVRVTVDDIIERKRKGRGDEGLAFSSDEGEDDHEAAEPEWSGFGDEGVADVAQGELGELADSDGEADIDEFGGAFKPEDQSSDEGDEENEEIPSDDDASEVASSYDSGSDSDSEKETAVDKARKAAYFATEGDDLAANGKARIAGEIEEASTSFQSFFFSRPLLRALADLSFATPTPIQSRAIPIALAGKDIVAGAVTGSGKTAAFMLPVLERLAHRPRGHSEAKTRVVVLAPTRELAVQCWNVGKALGKYTDVRFCLCVGGLSLKSQEQELKLRPEVVIATPGRLIDHIRNSASFGIEDIEILVMDEADRMLEEGFAAELNEIIQSTPKGRQTMLFSATMTDDVDELVRLSLKRPVRLFVDPKRTTATKLVQEFVRVRGATGVAGTTEGGGARLSSYKRTEDEARPALLLTLCLRTFRHQVIVFLRSKKLAHQLKILFGLMGLSAGELHGDLTQEQRLHALQSFKDGRVDFLLATDLASRGLDIKGVQTVINYDMPAQFEIYIHRVGRTARAGNNGRAVTLVGEQDRRLLKTVLKSSPAEHIKHRLLPVEVVASVRDRIQSLKGDVDEVLQEEKEEKALRQAEMELRKGTNMIEHRDEIMSRPKRTWFQTEKDKEASKTLSASEYRNKVDPASASAKRKEERTQQYSSSAGAKHDRFSGLSRKQKRTKMAKEELAEEEKGSGMSRGAMEAGIRSAKKASRPKELGVPEPRKGSKAAKQGADGGSKGRKKKRSSSAALKVGQKGGGFSKDLSERGDGGEPKRGGGSRGGGRGGRGAGVSRGGGRGGKR